MRYTACKVSLASLRSQPDERSEMVSQLLFGETAEVLDSVGTYRLLRCSWDGCEGWCDVRQLHRITPKEFEAYLEDYALSLALMEGLMAKDHFMPIVMGATLAKYDGLRCQLGGQTFQYSGSVLSNLDEKRDGDFAIKIAKRYLHAPELHGGRSPFGIDAAGFVQMTYKFLGIKLLRKKEQQVNQGNTVDFMEECQAGDLAFFDNGKGDIGHVGIMLDDCHIIHVHGQVRMDKVDHFGIFNADLGRYTHQLRVVKRFLTQENKPHKAVIEEKILEKDENQGSLFI